MTYAQSPVLEQPIATDGLDGSKLKIGLLYTRQCKNIVDALVTSCRGELLLKQVARDNIYELEVNVPFELPFLLNQLLKNSKGEIDAVICIGCLVQGHSLAYEFVAEAVTRSIMKIGVSAKIPVIDGVLTCTNMDSAKSCAGLVAGNLLGCNHGVEWAHAAIVMARFNQNLEAHKKEQQVCGEKGKHCQCGCECTTCHGTDAAGCNCGTCKCINCPYKDANVAKNH